MTRTFDWAPHHDPRSRAYPIRAEVPRRLDIVPKRWRTGAVLDQGAEGACVGFGWTGELLAVPRRSLSTTPEQGNAYARDLYRSAQEVDEWAGSDYEGTSVLAGAKVVTARGFMGGYRWAFGIEDVLAAILTTGPVVLGIWWYESMYATRPSGLVEVDGRRVGGHCILLTGYHPRMRISGEGFRRHEVFMWRNSWGTSYGEGGDAVIGYDDLAELLDDDGEACVPVNRRRVAL